MTHQPAPFLDINSPDVEIGHDPDLPSPAGQDRMARFLTHPVWPWVGDAIAVVFIFATLFTGLIFDWIYS